MCSIFRFNVVFNINKVTLRVLTTREIILNVTTPGYKPPQPRRKILKEIERMKKVSDQRDRERIIGLKCEAAIKRVCDLDYFCCF